MGTQSHKAWHCPHTEIKAQQHAIILPFLFNAISAISLCNIPPHMMSTHGVSLFHKLADPHIAGPFTRMTSSTQTMPTVLTKAQACLRVGVTATLRLT